MTADKDADRINPRVARTRDHVLAVARNLLPEIGPIGLTYSLLSERANVTRQTLYRHWPTRERLLAELVLTGPDVAYPARGRDVEKTVTDFLVSLRAGMSDAPTAAALTSLIAQADRDVGSTLALASIVEDRRLALNALLSNSGTQVSADDFAWLCGPILYRRFFAAAEVSDQFIKRTVRRWAAHASVP